MRRPTGMAYGCIHRIGYLIKGGPSVGRRSMALKGRRRPALQQAEWVRQGVEGLLAEELLALSWLRH
jgi:hypothetical protein